MSASNSQPSERLRRKRIIDDVADRGAVARARETVRQAPILQGVGRRPMPPLDVIKNFDGCRQPPAQSHVGVPASVCPFG